MSAVNPLVIRELKALQTPGAPSLLGELIDVFLREAEALAQKLRDSLAARDAAVFERSARTLKATSGNVGAQAMSRLCADLQTAVHAADWTRAAGLLPALETEFRAVKSELETERRKL